MRRSSWTPSIVPNGNDETVYLVADDFGRLGRAWREADYETTDLETVVQDLLTGQYNNPIRVIAFNTAERWSEDVSEDVARELRRRCDLQMRDLPSTISDFRTARGSRSASVDAAVGLKILAFLRRLPISRMRKTVFDPYSPARGTTSCLLEDDCRTAPDTSQQFEPRCALEPFLGHSGLRFRARLGSFPQAVLARNRQPEGSCCLSLRNLETLVHFAVSSANSSIGLAATAI